MLKSNKFLSTEETNNKVCTLQEYFFHDSEYGCKSLMRQKMCTLQRALKDIITITNRFTRDIYCKIQGI